MMSRRNILLILSVATALLVGAAVTVYIIHYTGATEGHDEDKHPTNSHLTFEDDTPVADPFIVGRWQNNANQQWFKVYYDDYDGDGFFWGKEWDESDDVQEEDLNYHGNGWFRWRKDGKQLVEMHTMDVQDVPIPKRWNIRMLHNPDSLIYTNADIRNQCHRFGKIGEF